MVSNSTRQCYVVNNAAGLNHGLTRHSLVILINTVVVVIVKWVNVVASDDGLLLDAGTVHHIFPLPTFLNDGK